MRDIWDIQNHDCESACATRLIATRRHTESTKVLRWLSKDESRTALVLDPDGMCGQRGEQQAHCIVRSSSDIGHQGRRKVLRYRAVGTGPWESC